MVATACRSVRGEGGCDTGLDRLLGFSHAASFERARQIGTTAGSDDDRIIAGVLVDVLITVLKSRDTAAYLHSLETAAWCARLCRLLNLDSEPSTFVIRVALLHDIGYIRMLKQALPASDALSNQEWAIIHKHPVLGAEVLAKQTALAPYAAAVRAHHERWDGRGYPDRLKGQQIPFAARVVAVADAFHAMISNRPYRKAAPPRAATETLLNGRSIVWDPAIVDAFIRLFFAERTCIPTKAVSGI